MKGEKMNTKCIFPVLMGLLIFSTLMVNKAESAELQTANEGNLDYLSYVVKAPKQVKIGETFSVIFEVHGLVDLDLDFVKLELYGSPIGWGEQAWRDSWEDMNLIEGSTYTKTATFEATKEGEVYGSITALFNPVLFPTDRYTGHSSFYVTQIHTKTYEELENQYNSLNQSYNTLQNNYDSLESNLNSTRTLMYAFIITTVAFIATSIYFAIRKPKVRKV